MLKDPMNYVQELNKDGNQVKGKGKGRGKNTTKNKPKEKPKEKCADCHKFVGTRAAIQCEGCNNLNLIECLSNISENRIKDFKMGRDKFVCSKCVMKVDTDTLTLEAIEHEQM